MESHILSLLLIIISASNCLLIGGGEVKEYDFAVASWYGEYHFGRLTANGEIFNDKDLTFAHKTMKFGTKVKFYYKGKTVIARCNDRGPYIKGREFDLSYQTAKRLGFIDVGVDKIAYKVIKEDIKMILKPFYPMYTGVYKQHAYNLSKY